MTTQETTDAEIWEATASIMISSDWDYRKLVGLSLQQNAAAMNTGWEAVKKIQTDNFEPDEPEAETWACGNGANVLSQPKEPEYMTSGQV